jgi:tetratricopeptide (TPR) repeat protein
MVRAKHHFSEARRYIDYFAGRESKLKALQGRLLGNLGNIALAEHDFPQALSCYGQSLKFFLDLDDREHIGIAKLKTAQTLISYSEQEPEDVPYLLEEANLIFMEIGWIEGQARVYEQFARYFERMLRRTRSSNKKHALSREALRAIGKSEALFRQVGQDKSTGRVEELRRRIENVCPDFSSMK